MANLSITAANVLRNSGTALKSAIAGETLTRGLAVYMGTDGKLYKGDANDTAKDAIVGIAMGDVGTGAEVLYAPDGCNIDIGATTTVGEIYVLTSTDAGTANGTAGGICLFTDLGIGDNTTILFVGTGTSDVLLTIVVSNLVIAA